MLETNSNYGLLIIRLECTAPIVAADNSCNYTNRRDIFIGLNDLNLSTKSSILFQRVAASRAATIYMHMGGCDTLPLDMAERSYGKGEERINRAERRRRRDYQLRQYPFSLEFNYSSCGELWLPCQSGKSELHPSGALIRTGTTGIFLSFASPL